MVFSSQIFLFAFLPIVLTLSLIMRRYTLKGYYWIIFIFSLVFYARSSELFVLLMLLSISLSFFGGLLIQILSERKRAIATFVIAAQVLIFIFFKYTYFVASQFSGFISPDTMQTFAKIILPIGISFYTFQSISYVIDVYRGDVIPETNFVRFGAYLSFFPQLIAGPIVRYNDVKEDFKKPDTSLQCFTEGVIRFSHGLLKKLLIADLVAPIADFAFNPATELNTPTAWIGILAYTIQIYFDFSAYSDMAIGLGLMFGIRFRENFNHPYSSVSLTDFWRRWHMSLSSWFRDYVYIPLGGNRHGNFETYRNLFLVFLLTGFWHGAGWTFILWGVYHGAFLMVERAVFTQKMRFNGPYIMRFIYVIPFVMIGWVLFRSSDIHHAISYIGQVFAFSGTELHPRLIVETIPLSMIALILGSLSFLMPSSKSFGVFMHQTLPQTRYLAFYGCYVFLALLVSFSLVFSAGYSPFLYFQF